MLRFNLFTFYVNRKVEGGKVEGLRFFAGCVKHTAENLKPFFVIVMLNFVEVKKRSSIAISSFRAECSEVEKSISR